MATLVAFCVCVQRVAARTAIFSRNQSIMNIESYFNNFAAFPSRSMAYLETIFPQQVALPILKAGQTLGMSQQTVRNLVCMGKFPLPTFKIGGRRMCHKSDVAAYLDALSEITPKHRRGARTKAERKLAKSVAAKGMGNE